MKVRCQALVSEPLDSALRQNILNVLKAGEPSAFDVTRLGRDVAVALAGSGRKLLARANLTVQDIVAAGACGPTSARRGSETIELLAPAMVAESLHLPVAGSFAASDRAVGGLGGPLLAWPDWLCFRHKRLSRVVVHLGGVVTITFVPAAAIPTDVLSFDVAPGTVVLGALEGAFPNPPSDRKSQLPGNKTCCETLLNELAAGEYFHADPPKRLDLSDWGSVFLDRLGIMAKKHRASLADLPVLFTELIAREISKAVGRFTERPHELILTGGASRNLALCGRIRALMSPSSTYPIERYGFPGEGYKAVCCAILAAARQDKRMAHCPRATGARQANLLGGLWQPGG